MAVTSCYQSKVQPYNFPDKVVVEGAIELVTVDRTPQAVTFAKFCTTELDQDVTFWASFRSRSPQWSSIQNKYIYPNTEQLLKRCADSNQLLFSTDGHKYTITSRVKAAQGSTFAILDSGHVMMATEHLLKYAQERAR